MNQRLASSGLKSVSSDLILVSLLSALIFIYAHAEAFLNPYVINDDVRQQIYWMAQYKDPQLFEGHWLTDYARHYVPWGVKGLYWLGARLWAPLYFGKLLTGALFVFLSGLVFLIGQNMRGRPLAWSAAAVCWLMPYFLYNMSGGLARSFASPLLALFWLCWLARRPWGVGLSLILQALFIPYIFVLSALAVGLAWLGGRAGWSAPGPFPTRAGHYALLVIAAGLAFWFNHSLAAAGYGPLVSAADMAGKPEFTAAGRFQILPVPSLLYEVTYRPWERIAPFQEFGLLFGGLVCALIIVLSLWGARRANWRLFALRVRQPIFFLALASLILYFLARLFLFQLFAPARYVQYSINLFYCLALALFLSALFKIHRWPRGLAVVVILSVAVTAGARLKGVGLYDYSAAKPLYAALAQTPKNALVAGHPDLMDNVITFGRRPVLASFELAHPWSKGLWQRLRPRLEELFEAYYAEDAETVKRFCRKYGVDYIVVDERHFSPDFLTAEPFFEPFGSEIKEMTRDRRRFALLNDDIGRVQRLTADIRLVDVRNLK